MGEGTRAVPHAGHPASPRDALRLPEGRARMRWIARERAMEQVDAEARTLAWRWVEVLAPSLAPLRPAQRRAFVERALATGSRDVEIIRGYLLRPADDALADAFRRGGFRRGVHSDVVDHGLAAFREEARRLIDERFPLPRQGATHPPESLGDAIGRRRRKALPDA